jgi:hypothetical protein
MNDPKLDETNDQTTSRVLQITRIVTGGSIPPPPLEPVKSLAISEGEQSTLTNDERPKNFGSLWREFAIVLLCTCGPITQVSLSPSNFIN